MSWLRLSIIGTDATELATANNGADWLVSTGLFTPALEDLRNKVSRCFFFFVNFLCFLYENVI